MSPFPINVVNPSGAVVLGPDIVCDGYVSSASGRVQTHVHKDHMDEFETSKGFQDILLTEPTKGLLIAELDGDLPYRSNLVTLDEFESCQVGNSRVTLVSSGHMLGSVQVSVELSGGLRLGYSGDFFWPLDHVIKVDALVVDSTYGSPSSIRDFSQGECEEQLSVLLRRLLGRGPVHIKAHRGTLQRALQVISDDIGCPVVVSQRLNKELEVYREFAYGIQPVFVDPSESARTAMADGYFVRVYSTGDQNPVDFRSGSRVSLSAFFSRRGAPIVEYSERSYCVAMSNHADFNGTLEYVRATGAEYVVTDNVRGPHGCRLAHEIQRRLGVTARPSSYVTGDGWGAVREL